MNSTGGSYDSPITGRVALVTGAGSGIGRATAILLAQRGITTGCADISMQTAEKTVAAITNSGGNACAVQMDVTVESHWVEAIDELLARYYRIDLLVNSAGISFAAPITEMRLEDWRKVLAVNLDGVFLGTKHAVAAMRRQPHGGTIINVSSAAGIKPSPGASAYSASKAAVCMFTKAVAKECQQRGDNIRLNTICPGRVKTPIWKSLPFFQELTEKQGSVEAAFNVLEESAPFGRFARPEEIANAILYLASDDARLVTGIDLIFDAGHTL
jgi:NAD(P)-dependent dehydrogenase (short-subunit alcohol dehydrogenase family)